VAAGYNWVDARDVVSGMIAAEERGARGRKYLFTGHWQSMRDLALLVEEVAGTRAPPITVPLGVAALAAPFAELWGRATRSRPLFTAEAVRVLRGNSRFSHERARTELGYCPRPSRDTVADTVAWFESQGLV